MHRYKKISNDFGRIPAFVSLILGSLVNSGQRHSNVGEGSQVLVVEGVVVVEGLAMGMGKENVFSVAMVVGMEGGMATFSCAVVGGMETVSQE